MRPHEEDVPGASAKNCARKPDMILPAPRAVVAKKSNDPLPSQSRPRTYEENDDHPRKNKHQDDESKYHRKRYRDDDKDDGKGDQHDEKHRRKKADKDDKKQKGNTKVDEKKKERGDEKTRNKNWPEKDDRDDLRQNNVKENKQRHDGDEKKKERDDEKTGKKKDDRDDMRQIPTKEKKQRDDDRKTEKDDGKPPTLIQVPQAGGTATTAHATPSARKASTLADDLSKPVQRKTKELASLEDEKKAMDTELETIPGKMQMHEEEIVERRTKILALRLRLKECQGKVEEKASDIKKKTKELLESKNNHAKAVVDDQKLEEHEKLLVTIRLKKVSEETPSASASDSSDSQYSEEKPSASTPDSSDKEYSYDEYSEEDEEDARKKRV